MVVRFPTQPDRWKQVESLFHAALGEEPDMRASFLAESCGDDAELFEEVERLLTLHSPEDDFLNPPDGTDG